MGCRRLQRLASGGVVIVVLLLLAPAACGGGDEEGREIFGYDDNAPLSVETVDDMSRQNGVHVDRILYASPRGGRVSALIATPPGGGPFAGIIAQHGLPGDKFQMHQIAEDFARTGAVVVAIDAPWARRGEVPPDFTERDRADQIQLMVDLRRAVDLLQSRDGVDDDRIAYIGIGYGAAMGGLLAGIEDRIAAFVLSSGDGGLVSHFTGPDDAGGPLSQLSRARRKRWLDAMRPIEPIKWIGKADAPVLFLADRNGDDIIPPTDARAYHQAAQQPKDVRWYDSGHDPAEAACDAARWLEDTISVDGDKHPGCR
jgi:dienelactone hydrolase